MPSVSSGMCKMSEWTSTSEPRSLLRVDVTVVGNFALYLSVAGCTWKGKLELHCQIRDKPEGTQHRADGITNGTPWSFGFGERGDSCSWKLGLEVWIWVPILLLQRKHPCFNKSVDSLHTIGFMKNFLRGSYVTKWYFLNVISSMRKHTVDICM